MNVFGDSEKTSLSKPFSNVEMRLLAVAWNPSYKYSWTCWAPAI